MFPKFLNFCTLSRTLIYTELYCLICTEYLICTELVEANNNSWIVELIWVTTTRSDFDASFWSSASASKSHCSKNAACIYFITAVVKATWYKNALVEGLKKALVELFHKCRSIEHSTLMAKWLRSALSTLPNAKIDTNVENPSV